MAEQELPGILVLTHGDFGTELIKSAEMIIGVQSNVAAIALLPGMDLNEFMETVKAKIKQFAVEPLILCDLFGGTPSNVAAAIKLECGGVVVTGVNLSMLIEACCQRNVFKEKELADAIICAGREGCRYLDDVTKLEENENII